MATKKDTKLNMKIEWKKVTWYSITFAVVLYIIIFYLGFCFGQKMTELKMTIEQIPTTTVIRKSANTNAITAATFNCKDDKFINAIFFDDKVELNLSDGDSLLLLQTISASGARYTNTGESFVFWNKGDTALLQQGKNTIYEDCLLATKK